MIEEPIFTLTPFQPITMDIKLLSIYRISTGDLTVLNTYCRLEF